MVWENSGISEVQKVAIRNLSGESPDYIVYAGSDNTFLGTETQTGSEILRNILTWESSGNNSKFTSLLTSVQGNGSYFGAIGLVHGEYAGSGTLFALNPAYIGNKTQAFNVQIEGEVIIRRPNV